MKNAVGQWQIATMLLALALCFQLPAQSSNKSAKHKPQAAVNTGAGRLISLKDQKRLEQGQVVSFTDTKPNGHRWVTARIEIKANPHVVWDTVHLERKNDPELAYSKVLSEDKNISTLEQKFVLLPLVGTAICVMKNEEVPFERIDYQLIKSDRFKAMEGSWVLLPQENTDRTVLELSSYVDLGLPIPRSLLEAATAKKIERRLGNVRHQAEAAQAKAFASKEESAVH